MRADSRSDRPGHHHRGDQGAVLLGLHAEPGVGRVDRLVTSPANLGPNQSAR